jgi:hypothetical protein
VFGCGEELLELTDRIDELENCGFSQRNFGNCCKLKV